MLIIDTQKVLERKDIGNGAVAQIGEHRTCTAEVAGAVPVSSTNRLIEVI